MPTAHSASAIRSGRSFFRRSIQRLLFLICGSGPVFLSLGRLVAGGNSGTGEAPAIDSVQAPQQTPAINFQVLSQQQVNVGGRRIIYNFVAPPVLPVPTPTPTPVPLTPEQQRLLSQRENKRFEVLFMIATVYDHQVSDVTLYYKDHRYRAFSHADFGDFDMAEIELPDVIYELFIIPVNETGTEWDTMVPGLKTFSLTKAQYIIVPDPANPPTPEALAALNALHSYYDANRQKLITDRIKREEAYARQQKWDAAHPPVPHDTTINYWPEKNSAYLKPNGGEH